jgi:hypothetical protein
MAQGVAPEFKHSNPRLQNKKRRKKKKESSLRRVQVRREVARREPKGDGGFVSQEGGTYTFKHQ